MKSSRKRKVTAAFFAAAALGSVAHAAPTLNMNDLVGSNTTTESTAQGNNNIATPVVRPMQLSYPCNYTISSKGNTINTACTSSTCKRYCKSFIRSTTGCFTTTICC